MRHLLINAMSAALVLCVSTAAHAVTIQFQVGAGSTVGVAYPGSPFANYSASGSILAEDTGTSLVILGGSLTLTGSGPDSSLTITPGELSYDGAGFFWDFGQGPFDNGVPEENPGYVLDDSGLTGTFGDMFGNFTLDGGFDAEGFGLADVQNSHTMTSFFWAGSTSAVVPVPASAWLLASALGLFGVMRRRGLS